MRQKYLIPCIKLLSIEEQKLINAANCIILKSAELKLERALYHINELEKCRKEFLNSNPYETSCLPIKPDKDGKTKQYDLIWKKNNPIPDQFNLILGDAIHNIRAAFDYLAFALVKSYAKDSPVKEKDISFPFTQNREQFEKHVKERLPYLCKNLKLIDRIEKLQPYKLVNSKKGTQKDLLTTVRDLDNIDKHRYTNDIAVYPKIMINTKTLSPVFQPSDHQDEDCYRIGTYIFPTECLKNEFDLICDYGFYIKNIGLDYVDVCQQLKLWVNSSKTYFRFIVNPELLPEGHFLKNIC